MYIAACMQTAQSVEDLQKTSSSPFVETLAYDSVWTLALALNRTMNMINTNDTLDCGPSPVPLEEFSYGNSSTACLIRHNLSKTNVTGLSVSITVMDCSFDYASVSQTLPGPSQVWTQWCSSTDNSQGVTVQEW